MANVEIVYGSGGGNTQLTCERVAELLEENGHSVALYKAKLTEPADLKLDGLLILASPTHGHGELEQYMNKFVYKAKGLDLQDKNCAVICLGDLRYEPDYFMEASRILTKFMRGLGGKMMTFPLTIADSPLLHMKNIEKWSHDLAAKL